jgi:nucleotide-binding universal stress UspA family protein
MKRPSTVIAGHDGTTRGLDAVAHASRIADGQDARLLVVHVIDHEMPYWSIDHAHQYRLREHAHRVFDPIHGELGRDVETQLVSALSTRAGLREAAEDAHAQLVVVGGSHHGPVGHVVYGDMAHWLTRHCDCPVEVAPVGAREELAVRHARRPD